MYIKLYTAVAAVAVIAAVDVFVVFWACLLMNFSKTNAVGTT